MKTTELSCVVEILYIVHVNDDPFFFFYVVVLPGSTSARKLIKGEIGFSVVVLQGEMKPVLWSGFVVQQYTLVRCVRVCVCFFGGFCEKSHLYLLLLGRSSRW